MPSGPRGGVPSISSSSSSSWFPPLKSPGPLCSLGPPCCTIALAMLFKRVDGRARPLGSIVGTYVLVPCDEIAHVRRRVLVELLIIAKDEDGNIDGAEDGQLMRLLEQATLSFEKGSKKYRVSTI